MRYAGVFLLGLTSLAWGQEKPAVKPVAPPQAEVSAPKPTTTPATAAPTETQTLTFAAQKLSLRLPLGWQLLPVQTRQAGTLASFAPLGTTGATLALSYADDTSHTRLPDNLPTTIAAVLAKRYPGFQQTGKQRVTLSGADAWILDGQVRPAGQTLVVKNRQVYVNHQGKIYIFTLTCKKDDFERLAPSLDRMLKSLTWLE
jgi:hypothetical protein